MRPERFSGGGEVEAGIVSLSCFLLLVENAKLAVFSFLPFSSLQPVASCNTGSRRTVRCDPDLWGSRLVSHMDVPHGDRKALDLELAFMLHSGEVEEERRARRIDVDGCSEVSGDVFDGPSSNWDPDPCPTPSGADVVASRRARSLAASPTLRCAAFAPYLVHMSWQLPPTRGQIERFVQEGLCQAHSWYKHLPLDRGVPFWVFLSPTPQAFGKTYGNEYGLLDWRSGRDGPPRSVRTPDGQTLVMPPGVVSGRDSRVYLSASCCMAPCLGEWVQKPSVADSAPYARTIMARMDQCAREQRAVFDAIVRQCRVLYGVHWEAQ